MGSKTKTEQVNLIQDRYLKVGEVANLLGIGVSTVYKWAKNGSLPAPYKKGSKATRWLLSEVMASLQQSNAPKLTIIKGGKQ